MSKSKISAVTVSYLDGLKQYEMKGRNQKNEVTMSNSPTDFELEAEICFAL